MRFTLEVIALVVCLAFVWRYLGSYMAAVFEGRVHWMGWLERPTYRLLGVDAEAEQTWQRYAVSLIVYSGVAILVVYGFERLQGSLPLNPQHFGAVGPALSLNTATSFVTNTNWQNYTGESTMSYLTQMVALVGQQFASAAAGMAVMIGMIRGFSRKNSPTIGNFWVDVIRGIYYILLPIAAVAAVIYIGQGAVQTLAGPAHIHDLLNNVSQTIPRGPQGSMTPIKQLGNNGGGYTNANGAHPFENPTAFTQWLSLLLLLSIPFASTYMYGKMVGSFRQGMAVLATMLVLFCSWAAFSQYAESRGNPAVAQAGVTYQPSGNMEGKETRFGVAPTTLFDIGSVQTSTGSVTGSNDSFTPIGGMGLLTSMMLGEVSPGGAGRGHVHDPRLCHHRRVHRRVDGRPNTGVPGQEDPVEGGEARRPPGSRDAHARPHLHRDRRLHPFRPSRARERGPARLHRDPLRLHVSGEQQRLGLCRPEREHALLQRHAVSGLLVRPLRRDGPRPCARWCAG